MEKRPYYRRFPSDFLTGVAGMKADEIGVYAVLLDLLYDRGRRLDLRRDRERQATARLCGCSTRKFGTILAELLRREKLLEIGGRITNRRFEREFGEKNGETLHDNRGEKRGDKSGPIEQDQTLDPEKPENQPRVRASLQSIPSSRAAATASPVTQESIEQLETDIQKICRAIGVDLRQDTRRAGWPMQLARLIAEDDLSVDLDLVPAIESYPANIRREVKSLIYFRTRARERRAGRDLNDRLAGSSTRAKANGSGSAQVVNVDTSKLSASDWQHAADLWLKSGGWDWQRFGPRPVCRSCLMPAKWLEQVLAIWRTQGDHPREVPIGNSMQPWRPGVMSSPYPEPIEPGSVE